jgi:hypothetical protein
MLAVVWANKHFRSYLYGCSFLVKTDHFGLTYLRKFADNNERLTRRALRLADLEFDIVHKPGTKIRHVDALSRHINLVTTTQAPSKDQVRSEQLKDRFCSTRVIDKLKGNSEYFREVDGVIYRRRRDGKHRLLVPASLARAIIALNHEPIFVAHPGGKRTLELLCLRYYFRNEEGHRAIHKRMR